MKANSSKLLLDHLKKGSVQTADWPKYGSSRKCLHVKICKLRKAGHDIVFAPGENDFKRGKPAGSYALKL